MSQSGHWCRAQQTVARVPTDRCCGTYILTTRADCRLSLRWRGGSASTARADIHIAEELSFFLHRGKAAWSPICEFGILAARARSTENAAIAKSSVPPRGGKTGNSCKAQQDKSVELTDCGQTEPPHRNRQRPVVVDFKLTIKPDGCIRDFSPTCALLIRAKYGSRVYESRV
jgi:hypothetical protein